jgi:hypothetical protein
MKATAMIKREGVETSVDSFFGDYKEVDGLVFPFSIEQRVKGAAGPQFTIEKVELGAEVPDDLFTMPEVAPAAQTQPSLE